MFGFRSADFFSVYNFWPNIIWKKAPTTDMSIPSVSYPLGKKKEN